MIAYALIKSGVASLYVARTTVDHTFAQLANTRIDVSVVKSPGSGLKVQASISGP